MQNDWQHTHVLSMESSRSIEAARAAQQQALELCRSYSGNPNPVAAPVPTYTTANPTTQPPYLSAQAAASPAAAAASPPTPQHAQHAYTYSNQPAQYQYMAAPSASFSQAMPVLQSSVRPISTGSGADSGVGAAGRIADFDIAPAQLTGGTAQLSMAMGDNEALRSRLNAKTSELFEVRRQLDRALEYLREQDLAFSKQKDQGQTDTQHIEENSLRLAKALADLEKTTTESNEKSHQILMLERDKDDLETTNRAISSDLQRGEEAITAARLKQEHTESDCEFRLNIATQSKAAVETELGSVRDQMQDMIRTVQKQGREAEEHRSVVEDLQLRLQRKTEQCDGLNRKVANWADEAERLRGELDAVKRQAFDQTRAADEAAKTSRLELHQLRSQVASLEVERQQLASAKLDLVHQVNRQKKRAEERDEQVRRLTRLLETKDQTISEMGPRFKESRRATGQASTGLRESSARKGWKA